MGFKKRNSYIIIFLLFLFAGATNAQDVSDTELWSGLVVKYDLTDKVRIDLEEQLRFYEDVSSRKTYLTEIGLRYEVFDFMDLTGKFRYSDNADARDERRFSLDLDLEYDIPKVPVDIKYRARLQESTAHYTERKQKHLRNLFGLDYNMSKRVDPYAEYEIFYLFGEKHEVRTHRFTFGLDWKLNKNLDLDTFYRRDQQANVNVPETQHIIGMLFSYSLN